MNYMADLIGEIYRNSGSFTDIVGEAANNVYTLIANNTNMAIKVLLIPPGLYFLHWSRKNGKR